MNLTNNIIPRQSNTHTWIRLAPWLWLGIFLCIAVAIWNQRVEPTTASNTESAWNPVSARDRSSVRDTAIDKRPIESMRVGQRVLAFNPKMTPEERLAWQEPDWENWLHLSLVIPKEDGSLLEMETLRSEDWVRSALQPIVSETSLLLVAEPDSSLNNVSSTEAHMAITPWRGVYRDMLTMAERSCSLGLQLDGFAVEMDLHELAISGPALIRDMKPCESVSSGSGHVITATFKHSSGDVIDLVWSDGASENLESVGTTSNHPFYSFDRGDYVQAGSLQEGERLLTYSGDTKRVVSKLARPGPEVVYNLEVFGEHVYFIGNDGVLVHNSDSYNLNATAPVNAVTNPALAEGAEFSVRLNPATRSGPMGIDTTTFTSGTATAKGGIRNSRQFWNAWADEYSSTLD